MCTKWTRISCFTTGCPTPPPSSRLIPSSVSSPSERWMAG
uniref:Uncharacterized protein n=1 Tax=Arundo donax TaxID=35708 RepID=A0A0A9F4Y9_ARUDO